MANTIRKTVDGNLNWTGAAKNKRIGLFNKARLTLTENGKKIDYLNTHCEISLKNGQMIFQPISLFMSGESRDKNGARPIDVSYVADVDLRFVRDTLESLGFVAEHNVYVNRSPDEGPTQDISVSLEDENNQALFKKLGQLFEFNRFSMQFRRLDKKGIDLLINTFAEKGAR